MTGLVELVVVGGLVLGLAIYDLAKTRKSIRNDKKNDRET
jgi:hypothetical protein